ncbi:MAG: hypothetical protein IJR82_05270 [Bacilli bacterium]|nr:hypothetical protein [Bacilli bacterium]
MTFINQPGVISKLDISVPKDIGEQFFKDMLGQLSNGLDVQIDLLSPDMQKTLDVMMKHKVPNDYLEIQYFVDNNKKKLFVATTNPNYSDLYWNSENAKTWVDESISIEDTPDKIIPILDDISKKTSSEYINYIDSQKRISNYISAQNPNVPPRIEKKSSVVLDAKETFENDYARLHSFQIV